MTRSWRWLGIVGGLCLAALSLFPPEATGTAWSLLPPVLAICLTFLSHNVYLSLLMAIWTAVLLHSRSGPVDAFLRTWDTYLTEALAPRSGDTAHAKIVLFTVLMGAFVELTRRTGITDRLVQAFARICQTRQKGQFGIATAGLLLFFDDYANSLLLGTAFRDAAARMRISRAKLAFLIDATAAPVAGVAIMSTWVGVELSYFGDSLKAVGYEGPVYALFLQTIPYRLYPLCMLGFVFFLVWQRRDFGPMYQAEQLAIGTPAEDAVVVEAAPAPSSPSPSSPGLLIDLLPFAGLLIGLLAGMLSTGIAAARADAPEIPLSLQRILDFCSPNDAMLWAAAFSVLLTVLLGLLRYRVTLPELSDAAMTGMQSMLPAITIIILAWTLATLCDSDHLHIAGYLVALLGDQLAPQWLPTITFVLCAAVSFATGSSWSTMGIMFPILIPLTAAFITADGAPINPADPLIAAVAGGILAGAIWGDHCSPISDTTVLTSAATGCNHVEHVRTQLPYAVTVGTICILCGTIPLGFGLSVWLVLPACLLACWLAIRLLGHREMDVAVQESDPMHGSPAV